MTSISFNFCLYLHAHWKIKEVSPNRENSENSVTNYSHKGAHFSDSVAKWVSEQPWPQPEEKEKPQEIWATVAVSSLAPSLRAVLRVVAVVLYCSTAWIHS